MRDVAKYACDRAAQARRPGYHIELAAHLLTSLRFIRRHDCAYAQLGQLLHGEKSIVSSEGTVARNIVPYSREFCNNL